LSDLDGEGSAEPAQDSLTWDLMRLSGPSIASRGEGEGREREKERRKSRNSTFASALALAFPDRNSRHPQETGKALQMR